MNIYKELPTAFPWYENINLQDRFRENVVAKAPNHYALITPSNALLPFEFWRSGAANITSWDVYTIDGQLALIIHGSNTAKIKTVVREGRHYFYYDGSALNNYSLLPGEYYSVINFQNAPPVYSEVFVVPQCTFTAHSTNSPFFKIEWWNDTDFRPIFYNDFTNGNPYFKNVVYLDTFPHVSEPEVIEEGPEDGAGDTVPTFVKAVIRYRVEELVADYLKIALVLAQAHDRIRITTPGGLRSGFIERMSTDTATEQNGALSVITIIFETDIAMIKKGCGDNMQ